MSNTVVLPTQRTGEAGERRPDPASRPTQRRFRPDIQGLRTVAIVTVALYHADVPFLRGGYIGVDVFFVISGFLITRQLYTEASARGRISLVKFYSARFRRLLPPVALVVAATVALAHYVLPYDQQKSLMHDVYFSAFYGLNLHFAAEGVQYQNAGAPPSPIQHFWSLAVEEQFYFVWPVLVGLCAVAGRRWARARFSLTVGSITLITAGTFAYSASISATHTALAYFSPFTRFWELGLGALVALTADRWAKIPAAWARALGWAGFAAVIGTAVCYDSHTVYPGVAAGVPVLGAALLIGSGVLRVTKSPETFLLDRPFMQYGGKVSYAWYLWHWPMLILLPAWAGHELDVWAKVEIVCLAFWFAVLTYFLENAAHRSALSYRRWLALGTSLSGLVAVVALVGTVTLPTLVGTGQAERSLALTKADVTAVQDAVKRSLFTKAVPSNLTPPLTRAAGDSPWEGSKKCFATLLMTTSQECEYGFKRAPADRIAVLVGDSHADQWLTALALNAEESDWKIIQLTKAACPIADITVYEQDLKRKYTECDTFRRWVEGRVAAIKPALVIASEADVLADGQVNPQVWAARTLAELNKLAGKTARIAYVGDTPTTFTNTVTCLGRNLSDAGRCAHRRTDVVHLDRYLEIQRTMIAARVGYVDTRPFFCGLEWCPAVVDNMLVHRDQGHITNTYARWLRPMLMPIFVGASK